MSILIELYKNDIKRYEKNVNNGGVVALYCIVQDILLEITPLQEVSILLSIFVNKQQYNNEEIINYLNWDKYYLPNYINYFDASTITKDFAIFVGYLSNQYYLWEFTKEEMLNYIDICNDFQVEPRKYLYGPAFDKNYQLYHIAEKNYYYRGYDNWPRLENSLHYDENGNFLYIKNNGLRILYPITDEEQEKVSNRIYKKLPTKNRLSKMRHGYGFDNLWSEYPDNYAEYPDYDHKDSYENPFSNLIDN